MGLIDKIKNDVKKSGQNKGKFMYFRQGQKYRVRFLDDMDDGLEVVFHDSFEKGINVPCQEQYGKTCPFCEEEGLRTRSNYAWSVYDYESKEVKIIMAAVNNCSPVPSLVALHENYGTLVDRDYVITTQGAQQNKTFSVIPMDKVRFKNDKIKAFTKNAVMQMIAKAWPYDDDAEGDEDKPVSKKPKAPVVKTKAAEVDDDDDEDEDDDVVDYSEMSAKELYTLCKERGIEVLPRKPEKYYIKNLEEADKAQEDWGGDEDEDEDEWEE